MKVKDVQKVKKSIVKIMGIHQMFHFSQPYMENEEQQYGGSGWFFDIDDLGKVPFKKNGVRFLFTNFHVIDSVVSKQVDICFPNQGFNRLRASVEVVVPTLDCAILKIDPNGDHPCWNDGGSIHEFLDAIPNLRLDSNPIKGNSQQVTAVGFPSLSTDYQLCEGVISGRGLGMIQLNISFNGGISGSPLLHKNKVIGICTASEAEAEAIGLAVPIQQVLRFFRNWATYDDPLMRIPSWGIEGETLTKDYLRYHNMDDIQGVLVKGTVPGLKGLEKRDIILGVNSDKRYNIDCDGLVKVDWTDKRVPISNNEFILSLNPENISLSVYKHRTKKRVNVSIKPEVINFKTYEKHHAWEEIPYCTFAGSVWMDLSMNHLEEEDEDEEPTVSADQSIPLAVAVKESMHMKSIVVCTHIPGQTYISNQRKLRPFDMLLKINKTKIKDVNHMQEVLVDLAKNIGTNRYVMFEMKRGKVYFDLERVIQQEKALEEKFDEQIMLTNATRKRKRKRTH